MKEDWKMGWLTSATAGAAAVMVLGTLAAGNGRRIDGTAAAPIDGATPPIVRELQTPRDTPPAGATAPAPAGGGAPKVSKIEYEGWRQYSVNCARCHGQDVLPNPVAANLLISLAPGGPVDTEAKFVQVVTEGRPERGMPAFKGTMSPEQIQAVHAYVKGRAEKRIPPGRPANPT